MVELDLDNILDQSEIEEMIDPTVTPDKEGDEKNKNTEEKPEVNPDDLFDVDPESVGGEDNKEEGENADDKKNASPSKNFYLDIAKALKEDSILPDLDDKDLEKINDADGFSKMIQDVVAKQLDERSRRIEEALNSGVEPSVIKEYESTIENLDTITIENIEDDNSENLRKNLIYQDFINRGYSKERAQREVQKSLANGSDIDDAKEALDSNKEFFKSKYDQLLKEAAKEEAEFNEKRRQQSEQLKKSLLEDEEIFKGLKTDKLTRQKAYENITKPVFRDAESGDQYTAIQKYEIENRVDFMKKVGLIFTLTDGFTNIDKLVSAKVNKEVKKNLRELETTINNTARNEDGVLSYASGMQDDKEAYSGWSLDIN